MFKFRKLREFISLISLILCDIAALLTSFLIAYFIRIQVLPAIIPGITPQALPLSIHLRYGFLYGILVVIFVFTSEKLYTKRLAFWDESKHLLKGIILSFILLIMIVFISRGYTQYSRPVIITAGFLSLFLFPLFRLGVKNFLVKLNIWKKKILILGTNRATRSIAHERLGRKNKTFRFFKFRSMYVDGDLRLNKFLRENSLAKKEWKKYRKIKQNDPRVTHVGKFIRKYSLDELPQLINVLKGDMSLVGPRPYMPRERKDVGESYPIISRVKPGITGLWQVRGRNILPFEERVVLDEYYIRNWSLWLDMVILIKTIKAFFTREGAY